MASLVSPGVSVQVVNDSFYIPASAPTVPLFFIATKANKKQPNGITTAAGTNEHGVVRTITSIGQSVQLYGIPNFLKDGSGNEYHGDARNEYGLMALNQYLGLGNRAYVVRANVDAGGAADSFVGIGTVQLVGDIMKVGQGGAQLNSPTAASNLVKPQKITIVFTSETEYTVSSSVNGDIGTGEIDTEFTSTTVNFSLNTDYYATTIVAGFYVEFSLGYVAVPQGETSSYIEFINLLPSPTIVPFSQSSTELWTVTFTSSIEFTVEGSLTAATNGSVGVPFNNGKISFTIPPAAEHMVLYEDSGGITLEDYNTLLLEADTDQYSAGDSYTAQFGNRTIQFPIGSTDSARRTSIVTALQSVINTNQEVRATDMFEYNIIVAPGYPEVIDELMALSGKIMEEAFVIADTPVNKDPEQVASWALTTARAAGTGNAYYYPWGLASNLDGRNVVCAPSGIALRTFAYSDDQSYVWFAPAGARRGLVTGVNSVGYVTGTLGTATTFVETNLNQGQRDNLYETFKNLNPIVFFAGRGLLIWGQKTSATASSALDRVNVVRLVMYLKRVLRKGAFPFVFEPNDKITRDNLKAMADGLLGDVMAKRGLYDFGTMCNEENNTPFRIDNNEMYLDVAIKPVRAAEFIYIPLRVLSTGAAVPS